MSARGIFLVGTALLGAAGLAAADEETPDAEFLEYLGLWDESDEEWLIFNTPADEAAVTRNKPPREGEESMENDDDD